MAMAVLQFLSFMLVMVGLTLACQPPEASDSQSLEERAKVPDYIIYGTVISDKMKTITNKSIDVEYEVKLEPLCWLKRDHESAITGDGAETNSTNQDDMGLQNITVREEAADCVKNDLKMGKEYILFLKKYEGGMYVVFDVNEESGAIEEPSDGQFEAVHRGIYASIQGRPEAECREGVAIPCFVGNDTRNVCSKGVAQGVAVWALVLPAVIALAGYF
ncbi:uncharacterized protein LOC119719789 [Patiria miniata]|uniref:Uncharacterized protein n=1 Tax=Patiria miniata TaxID=46514 RepID=A0A913Z0L8_PATMI|nr:uncharacterized protein LOC119719789 [Patiria miniata]